METGWRRDWFRVAATATAIMTLGCAPAATDGIEDTTATRARAEPGGGNVPASRRVSALVSAPPKRTRTIAALLLDPGGPLFDMTVVTGLLTGPGNSLPALFNEISYGLQRVSIDMYGPNPLPTTDCATLVSGDQLGQDPNGVAIAQQIAALPMTYDHYFLFYAGHNANCVFGSLESIGTPAQPAVYSIENTPSIIGVAQALGANLGMTHEPTMTCPGPVTFADDPSQCTHNEYGSRLSFMGGGAHHPSAYQKYAQGWIDKCNAVAVGASGTFNLVPQELACGGVQLLQIPAPKVRAPPSATRQGIAPLLSYYYAEMRAPLGFDTGLGPMVVISIGDDVPTMTTMAPQLYVLDMVPAVNGLSDLTNMGLSTPGQSYSDPAGGLTITLMTISEQGATISVTTTATGGSVCAGGTPFSAPGPDGASCAPLTGAGGAGGAAGAGGLGGTGGTGGIGGLPGTGGGAGSAGSAGADGTGGSQGSGGSTLPGSGGRVSATGGRTGSGGTTSVPGTDGGPSSASGGQGAPATGAPSGGCSCSTAPVSGRSATCLSLLVCATVAGRRRSKRPHR